MNEDKTPSHCSKNYKKPTLKEFGKLHLTTRGSMGGMPDGGVAMMMGVMMN